MPLGDSGLNGPFEDSFTFTIAPGEPLVFSAALSTGFISFLFSINGLNGSLVEGTTLVEAGNATTTFLPEGFPSFNLAFDPVPLAPGDYSLDVGGTVVPAFSGPTGAFTGTLILTAAPVVMPEPGSASLLLGGLAMLAAWAVRRRGITRRTPRAL